MSHIKHSSSFAVMAALTLCYSSVQAARLSEADQAALRASDIATLNNLMGNHAWYHSAFMNDVELEKYWVKTPEHQKTAVWAQNSDYWIGMDTIRAYYGPTTPREQTKSQIQFHTTTTGVVEVAADRKTAKGVWYTPGVIGAGSNKTGLWERYGIDFVRENGEWKIWHLHVYTDFGYSMSGGAGGGMTGGPPQGGTPSQGSPQGGPPPAGGAPESAERFGSETGAGGAAGAGSSVKASAKAAKGYAEVGDNSYADLIPRPPEPYATFSDTWSYGDPDEVKMFSGAYKEWSEIKKEHKK